MQTNKELNCFGHLIPDLENEIVNLKQRYIIILDFRLH